MSRWNNPNCGFQKGHKNYITEEVKIKTGKSISKSMMGHKVSELTKRKVGLANSIVLKGRKLSDKHKENISLARISMEQTGEKSHFWKGGITPKNIIERNCMKYRIWRDMVFQRDKYLCQMPDCDKAERYLNAHHIKKFSIYKELRFDITNGITLCKKCHNKTKRREEKFEDLFIEIIKNITDDK